jgi:hypothetical protein
MHVCKDCLDSIGAHVHAGLQWVDGVCKKCHKAAFVTFMTASFLCPFHEHHPHSPEIQTDRPAIIDATAAVTSGGTTALLSEEYYISPPQPWPWYNRQPPPPDEGF